MFHTHDWASAPLASSLIRITNITKVWYTRGSQEMLRTKNTEAGQSTAIWIAMSLPKLSSGETKKSN